MSWTPPWLSRRCVPGVVGVESTHENGSTSPKVPTKFCQFATKPLPPPSSKPPLPLPLDEYSDPTDRQMTNLPSEPVTNPYRRQPLYRRFMHPPRAPSTSASPIPPDGHQFQPLPALPLRRTATLSQFAQNRPVRILLPRERPEMVPVVPAPSPKSRTGIVPVMPVFHGRQGTSNYRLAQGARRNTVAIPLPTLGIVRSNVLYRVPDNTATQVQPFGNFRKREPLPVANLPQFPSRLPTPSPTPDAIPETPLPDLPEDTLFNGSETAEQQASRAAPRMRSLGSMNSLGSCDSLSSMVTASSSESLASMVTASSCDSLTSMVNSSPESITPDRSNSTSPHILQQLNQITVHSGRTTPELKVECPKAITPAALDSIFTTPPPGCEPGMKRFCAPAKQAKGWLSPGCEGEAQPLCGPAKQPKKRWSRTKHQKQRASISPSMVVRAERDPAYCPPAHMIVRGPEPNGSDVVPNKARSCRGCVKDKKKCDGGRPCLRCSKKGRVCMEPPRTRKRKLNEHFCWDCFYAKRPKYSFPSISNLRRHQRESCVFNPDRMTRRVTASDCEYPFGAKRHQPMAEMPVTFGGPLSKVDTPVVDFIGMFGFDSALYKHSTH